MANEALVQSVKEIVARAKEGDVEGSYHGYRDLFLSEPFLAYSVADQRLALRLMITKKGMPRVPSPAIIEAHRAAVGVLTELVSTLSDPGDHELLGLCHVLLGNEASASAIFKAGLAIERARNPSSDLCGQLMKCVASV